MDLPIIGAVIHERYTPGPVNPDGLRTDAWAAPEPVATHGWWQPSPDEPTDSAGRRSVERDLDLMIPVGTVCGDRDRWTVAGDRYIQQGDDQDANHGPFGMAVPLVVHLKKLRG